MSALLSLSCFKIFVALWDLCILLSFPFQHRNTQILSCWTELNTTCPGWHQGKSKKQFCLSPQEAEMHCPFTKQHYSLIVCVFLSLSLPSSSAHAHQLPCDSLNERALPLSLVAELWHCRPSSTTQACNTNVQRNISLADICPYNALQMQDNLADISYSWNNSHPVTSVTCISLLDIKYRINFCCQKSCFNNAFRNM